MKPLSEIATLERDIENTVAELAIMEHNLAGLSARAVQEREKISCPICNEPQPDGQLEACSKCYGRHYVSTCKIDDIKKLLREFPASNTTEAEALIQIDTITTRGDDRK